MKQKTEIRLIIDINLNRMNKFLILTTMIVVATTLATQSVFAQQAPPPLEKPEAVPTEEEQQSTTGSALGKVTIQISQTEQIIIDLPLKSENKYQIIPIK